MTLRGYRGEEDLPGLRRVAAELLRDRSDVADLHPGEVVWWICRPAWTEDDLRDRILIDEEAGEIRAWAMDDGEVVELVAPRWIDRIGERFFQDVTAWLAGRPGRPVRLAWADGHARVARLDAAGYRVDPAATRAAFRRSLGGAIPASPDVEVRALERDDDPRGRCAITHAAFGVAEPFDRYVDVYARFVRSPWYPAGFDLVADAPDGTPAACCIAWIDPVSGVGAFEPVATHPDHRRRGYGAAVLREGLRRMADAGMHSAIVTTPASNAAARALYRAVGFDDERTMRGFVA